MDVMKDHRTETTMVVSLDGVTSDTVLEMDLGRLQVENRQKKRLKEESNKMDRFLNPTKYDVMASVENVFENEENQGKMVIDLEAGRLIAFRMVGGRDGTWERTPPVDGWREKGDEYCYFFVIEPADNWSEELFMRYSNILRPKKDECPGNYFGIKVYTKSFSNRFDDEGSQLVSRCGFCDVNEDNLLEILFDGKAEVSGDFHYLKIEEKPINATLSSWPPNYGNAPSREVRTLQNRMMLMTIGGDYLPAKYQEDKAKLKDYIYDGGYLINLLINEKLFDINEEMGTQLTKLIADARKIEKALAQRYAYGELDRNRAPLPTWTPLNEKKYMTNLFSLITDVSGMLFNGLNGNSGKYELGSWQFEVDISEQDEDGLHEINGIRIRNVSIDGWELYVFNSKPEKVYEGELMELTGDFQNIKVDRMVLRKIDNLYK